MKAYKTIEDILQSSLIERMQNVSKKAVSDRVLKSTRLEQQIYQELHHEQKELQAFEKDGCIKLPSFNCLVNDTFQSFYSINPKYADEDTLSTTAKKLNKFILKDIMESNEYPTIKSICEGRELPSIEATCEFTESLLPRLDELLNAASGQKDSMNVLEKIEKQRDDLLGQLSERIANSTDQSDEKLKSRIVSLANKAESKAQQAEILSTMVDRNLQKNKEQVQKILKTSIKLAEEKAETVKNVLLAWGDSSDGQMKNNPVNTEILQKASSSKKLSDVARFLGRYKEMLCNKRKNGYAYGRGEKYDITLGNSLSKALTSELSLLAAQELTPMFIQKYQGKRLKQYRRREAIYKGSGDIIVCLDESDSTKGEKAAWGMSIALVLLETCKINKRNFVLIHFSDRIKTDIFRSGEYDKSKVFEVAETFLSGGTNYGHPLMEAIDIIGNGTIEKPDIVFITDGECDISEDFEHKLSESKARHKFSITGILLDQDRYIDFSLQKFCEEIYRTSELCNDTIVSHIISKQI